MTKQYGRCSSIMNLGWHSDAFQAGSIVLEGFFDFERKGRKWQRKNEEEASQAEGDIDDE
ncbi:hypothetical protein QFC24_003957 [Naganishia onofrii]|uniref:Uncharacterized protein n=1 Tax=Naganishia onofrii TaxID=1851511 RepID=A0ACC2XFU5_9TREE|nr:hypothetical protein QFC24_003957 [Naganishia onofrii]